MLGTAMDRSPYENLLESAFRLPGFRVGQREIIEAVLEGKDVMAVLPTGGGKSLCFQFPAVYANKLVVVISPLIALMKDQVMNLRARGIQAGAIHSGQPEQEKREIFRAIQAGGPYVLYLSPERAQKDGFRNWIRGREVALFAIDEAHCVSQWGHDFRAEYSQLHSLKEIRPDVPVLALTASATPTVLRDIALQLGLVKPSRMVHGFYRPNLYYQVEFCEDEEEKRTLLDSAISATPSGRIIVYCGTRKITEEVAERLKSSYADVGYYHAGMTPTERTQMQAEYAQGKIRILVATNAFGMGIDQPDVRLVVHYQMPANIDALYQEMGRAGRDGEPSTCLMLYSKKDKGLQSFFIQSSEAPKEIKDARWKNLEALVFYSEGGECRHSEILTYYKDSQRIESCGHCDTCDPASPRKVQRPVKRVDLSKNAQLKRSRPQVKKVALADESLNPVQEKRFIALKSWRKRKAAELDLPAFVVFGDQTLRQLAIKNPRTIDDLRGIYGVGEAKLERYGWDLVAELGANG